MPFGLVSVWTGPSGGGGFNDNRNWNPGAPNNQAPGPNDLAIFNTGGAISIDGQNSVAAEIDVVLGTTLTFHSGLEGNGSVSGVAFLADSGGTLIVPSGAEMADIGAVDVIGFTGAGSLRVTAGGSLDDSGLVMGDRASGTGTVSIDGAGALVIVSAALPGNPNGILIIGNAGTGALTVSNGGSLGSLVAELGAQTGAIGTATLNAAKWDVGTLTIGPAGRGSVAVQSGGILTSGKLEIDANGTLSVAGTATAVIATLAFGTMDVTQGGHFTLGTAPGPAGAALVDTGYTFTGLGTLNGNVVLNPQGTLQATGTTAGALRLTGNVTGTGTLAPLMTLDLNGTVAAGIAITFSIPTPFAPGLLILENAAAEAGTIAGFARGNTIEIPGLKFTTTLFTQGTLANPGTLVLSGGTETPISLAVAGAYTPRNFLATPSPAGTIVTLACFLAGTKITTEAGECPVEHLQIGTTVRTNSGKSAAVRWLGHRRLDSRRHPNPEDIWPIRILAHAFAPGQPARDLLLSPDHAVFVGGNLIPIRHLINARTIRQQPQDDITYWHVELANHDIMLAEHLPCESYLDTGNRGAFANGGDASRAHPKAALQVWADRACAPLIRSGPQLDAARRALQARAAALGHATTENPALHLTVNGRTQSPDIHGQTHRFRLPATACGARLASRHARPAHMRASTDHRPLGVAVSRITWNQRPIALTDARLSSGWHDAEYDNAQPAWRWTDGDAGLAIAGGGLLEIEIALTERYWLEAVENPGGVDATGDG